MCPSRALGHVQALGRGKRARPTWVPRAIALADMQSTFAAGDFWFSGDYWTHGGSGSVSELTDHRDATHKLLQPTLANRPGMITGSVGKNCLTFGGNAWMDSNRSASWWQWMHLVGTVIAVWCPTVLDGATEAIASTYAGPGFTSSAEVLHISTQCDVRAYQGTTFTFYASGPGTLVANQWTYHGYRLSGTQYTGFERGSVIGQGAPTNTPAGTGNVALRVGMRPNASLGARMQLRALYGWQRFLSNADLTKVRTWIQHDTGITP